MITTIAHSSRLAFIAMAGTAAGDVLESHSMSLPTVMAVGAVVFTGTWALSKRFQNIEDRLGSIEKNLGALNEKPTAGIDKITAVLESLLKSKTNPP